MIGQPCAYITPTSSPPPSTSHPKLSTFTPLNPPINIYPSADFPINIDSTLNNTHSEEPPQKRKKRKSKRSRKAQGRKAKIMDIRVLHPSDIPHVQLANITNLPENYFCKYYLYHAMSWPQLSYVAVDVSLEFCS